MSHEFNRRRFVISTASAVGGFALGLGVPTILRAGGTDQWGDLVGRFVYEGPPPERKKLVVDKDLQCCGKFDIRDETVLVKGDDHGLMNVYVYPRSKVSAISPELAESVEKRVVLDNKDCIFQPHCMAVWAGKQEYYIVNSDPVAQNVAFNPLLDVPANIILPVGGDATWKFHRGQRAPVQIACNYHPWEKGFVLPRDDPYTAISGPDGTFKISRLPVGKLELQVWHEAVTYLDTPSWPKGRLEVTIKPGVNDLGTIKITPKELQK